MSALNKIRLVSFRDDENQAENAAILESRDRVEAEIDAQLAAQARSRAEAHARAIAQNKAQHESEIAGQIEVRNRVEVQFVEEVRARLEQERVKSKLCCKFDPVNPVFSNC